MPGARDDENLRLPLNLTDVNPEFRFNIPDPENLQAGYRGEEDAVRVELPPLVMRNGQFSLQDLRLAIQQLRMESLRYFNTGLAFTRQHNAVLNRWHTLMILARNAEIAELQEERRRQESRHRALMAIIAHLITLVTKVMDLQKENAELRSNSSSASDGPRRDDEDDYQSPPKRPFTRSLAEN